MRHKTWFSHWHDQNCEILYMRISNKFSGFVKFALFKLRLRLRVYKFDLKSVIQVYIFKNNFMQKISYFLFIVNYELREIGIKKKKQIIGRNFNLYSNSYCQILNFTSLQWNILNFLKKNHMDLFIQYLSVLRYFLDKYFNFW